MKQKFYIFLDIDGTMWDMKDLRVRKKYAIEMNPESGKALTILMDSLNMDYDADLVITSRRRTSWESCLDFFRFSCYDIDKYNPHMTHLKHVNKPRGVKIAEYMYNAEKGRDGKNLRFFLKPFEKMCARKIGKKMTSRFVVIDDDMRPISGILPNENLIHTNKYIQSLNCEMVESFLKCNNIKIVKQQSEDKVLPFEKKPVKQSEKQKTDSNEKEMGADE